MITRFLILGEVNLSDKDRVDKYKNMTIIPPKKIKAITKKSQEELYIPAIEATSRLIRTIIIDMDKGLLALTINNIKII